MKQQLDVAFIDVAADGLRWALDLPMQDRLAHLDVAGEVFSTYTVHLSILGASHQVVVRDAEGTPVVNETVACLAEVGLPLPERHVTDIGPFHYDFTARIEVLDDPSFATAVERVRRYVAGRTDSLLAEFPGSPMAITAIAEVSRPPMTIGWMTWHAYPSKTGRNELVITETSLTSRGG